MHLYIVGIYLYIIATSSQLDLAKVDFREDLMGLSKEVIKKCELRDRQCLVGTSTMCGINPNKQISKFKLNR